MSEIAGVFEEMVKHFSPDAAGDTAVSYLFDISGPKGGKWVLDIADKKCELVNGSVPSPTVTISLSDEDWLAIREGKLNSQMAFMQGKLRIAGDMNLAMKLQTMFPIA